MKYLICFAVLLWTPLLVAGITAKFTNFNEYFPNLMRDTIYELEKYGWWNLELRDQTVTINQEIYDRHFEGHVNYTNGFLVSIQHLEFTNVRSSFSTSTGSMAGRLHFKNPVIGYDVSADLGALGVHRLTGSLEYTSIDFDIWVQQNLTTGVITTSASVVSVSSNFLMIYLPASDIGEVLSRHFVTSSIWDGVNDWARNFIAPFMLELIKKNGFPEICYDC